MLKLCRSHSGCGLQCRGLLLALAALSPAFAQDTGFYKDLKLRLGYGLVSEDHLRQSAMGFGLNLGYANTYGKWAVELGYYYKTGDQYIQPTDSSIPAGLTPVDLSMSGDSRRNQLDGFAVRLSYERKLDEEWNWQAGLMLGGTRFKHEYAGEARSQGWDQANAPNTGNPSGVNDPHSWLDTYSGTPTQGGLKISPYAGFSWAMTNHSSLEFNLMLLNYTALDYVHHPGTGTYALSTDPSSDPNAGRISVHNGFPGDSLTKTTRFVPHLEFGYVIHF